MNVHRYKVVRHLLEHMSDKAHHPFKCPLADCALTSVRLDVVQSHVKKVHKLEWTDQMVCLLSTAHSDTLIQKEDCVNAENKRLIDSLTTAVTR